MRREIVDWEFLAPSGEWLPASVPGCIHTDLLRHGLIPEPFGECHEASLLWIGERCWRYRGRFLVSAEVAERRFVNLHFEGLDTFCTLRINGVMAGQSDNMFVPMTIRLCPDDLILGDNLIEVEFDSAWQRGKELEARYGVMEVWNGDPSRVYVRKAQYHYGWDWGPTFITCGIWRRAWIEAADGNIELSMLASYEDGIGRVEVRWNGDDHHPKDRIRIQILDPVGDPVESVWLESSLSSYEIIVRQPKLWGNSLISAASAIPSLYRIELTLQDASGTVLASETRRIGFRNVELRNNGVFEFHVNGQKLFCGGANWIPADSFPSRVTPDCFRELLTAAKEAGMSMIRIWGGGIYEDDLFYDVCDELEILVWQDFMFACGLYPAHDEFIDSVLTEVRANVSRLQHHPCIAFWCGNNEDYQLAGSRYHIDDTPEINHEFPARVLYEEAIPCQIRPVNGFMPYVPGSPFGGPDGNSPTEGDRHVWEVWHGKMQPYQDYPKHGGRFVSEFGMGSYPDVQTLEPWIKDTSLGSVAMRSHHKALGGDERIHHYLSENFPVSEDSETYAFCSQLVQAEALRYAYEGFRRDGSGGALVWQLNDCWPTISWSIIDYDLRPKPAYYAIKRALKPIALSALLEGDTLRVAVMNSSPCTWRGVVRLDRHEFPVDVRSGESQELERRDFSGPYAEVRLESGDLVDRRLVWREPFKDLPAVIAAPGVMRQGDRQLRIEVCEPTPFVWVQTDTPVRWSDNLLHLLPGDRAEILADRDFGKYRLQWYGGMTEWQIA